MLSHGSKNRVLEETTMGGDWIQYAIPLVVLAVWILSNLGRSAQQRAEKQLQAPRPAPRPASPPAAKGSDIDRFLEEVNQRRRRQQQEKSASVRPTPAEPARPRPRPTPPVKPRPRVQEPILVTQVVLPAEPAIAVALPAAPVRSRPASLASAVIPATLAGEASARSSATATPLRELLQSSEGLRVAVLMNEILGPPRCRRPLRGR
jgi:hypothetical protein